MNQQNADYQSGFLAGMEYQERVEVDLLEALKLMEARFGCRSSRAEEQPKTYARVTTRPKPARTARAW